MKKRLSEKINLRQSSAVKIHRRTWITLLLHFGRKLLSQFVKLGHLNFSGPYNSWTIAQKEAVGYNSDAVIEKVSSATRSVLDGQSRYERDGTVFNSQPKRNRLATSLERYLKPGSQILDFGGGLGGTWLANRSLLLERESSYWIIEQPNFVLTGKDIANEYNLPISYCDSISNLQEARFDVLILSSVLQYLENWKEVLSALLELSPDLVIIDRTPINFSKSQVFVQENEGYYTTKVSYPSWNLSLDELLSFFNEYEVLECWNSDFDPEGYFGFLLTRKEPTTTY